LSFPRKEKQTKIAKMSSVLSTFTFLEGFFLENSKIRYDKADLRLVLASGAHLKSKNLIK